MFRRSVPLLEGLVMSKSKGKGKGKGKGDAIDALASQLTAALGGSALLIAVPIPDHDSREGATPDQYAEIDALPPIIRLSSGDVTIPSSSDSSTAPAGLLATRGRWCADAIGGRYGVRVFVRPASTPTTSTGARRAGSGLDAASRALWIQTAQALGGEQRRAYLRLCPDPSLSALAALPDETIDKVLA